MKKKKEPDNFVISFNFTNFGEEFFEKSIVIEYCLSHLPFLSLSVSVSVSVSLSNLCLIDTTNIQIQIQIQTNLPMIRIWVKGSE